MNYIQDITEVDISNSDESDLVNVENNNDTNDNENVNEYLTYNLFINALEKLDYNDYGQIKSPH